MKVLLIISLLFFMMVSCKKNDVTVEKKHVAFKLHGKQIKAEETVTHYFDGSSRFNLISAGGKNLIFIQISPMGIIKDFGGSEASFLSCMNAYSTNCNKSFFCSTFCRSSAMLACGGGWVLGCLTGHTDPKL